MNGYERIIAVLNGGTPDRVPTMLHSFMPAAEQLGYSMREYRSDAKKMAKAQVDFARKYDLDGIFLDVDTCLEAGAVGVPLDLPENEPARVIGPVPGGIDAIIEAMEPEKLLQYDRVKVVLEAVNIMRDTVKGELLIRGNCDQMAFSLAMLSYGMTDFLADLLDEDMEEKIFLLMNRAYEVHLAFHKLMLEAGADITSFGDSSCGPDLISRDMYLKYAFPFHKRLQQDVAAIGAQTVCHICGKLDLIIEDIAAIGFAGVEIDYKTTLPHARDAFSGKSAVFGIIDPSGIFYFASPEEVAKTTRETLDVFSGRGIVIGAGCALPTGTPDANIRAFSEAARAYPL